MDALQATGCGQYELAFSELKEQISIQLITELLKISKPDQPCPASSNSFRSAMPIKAKKATVEKSGVQEGRSIWSKLVYWHGGIHQLLN